MKKYCCLLLLSCLLMAAGCAKSEYDISENLDTEVTLLGDHITVPLFDLAPATIKSVGGTTLENFCEVDSKGNYYIESEESLGSEKLSALIAEHPDGEACSFAEEDVYFDTPTAAIILSALGFAFVRQTYEMTVENPLAVPVQAKGFFRVLDEDDNLVTEHEMTPTVIPAQSGDVAFSFTLPDACMGTYTLSCDFSIDLPEHFTDAVESASDRIAVKLSHTAFMASCEKIDASVQQSENGLDAEISKYKVSQGVVTFDAENTFPFNFRLTDIKLKKDKAVLGGVSVVMEDVIPSGTMNAPAKMSGRLTIKAADGYLPDFDAVSFSVAISAGAKDNGVLINDNEALTLTNLNLVAEGGIKLFGNE